jgi:hypothetical protein
MGRTPPPPDVPAFSLTPPSACPRCASPLTAAGGLTEANARPPRPGDITVCINCGELLAYIEGLDVRPLDLLELLELDMTDVAALLLFQKRVRARGRLRPRSGQ